MSDDDEIEEGCGYTWDHTLPDAEAVDGVIVQVCRECGAEIVTDVES